MDKILETIYGVILDYVDDIYDLRDMFVILGVFKSMELNWTKPKRNYHDKYTCALIEIAENAQQLKGARKVAENTYQLEVLTYKYLTTKSLYLNDIQDKYEMLKEKREQLFDDMYNE